MVISEAKSIIHSYIQSCYARWKFHNAQNKGEDKAIQTMEKEHKPPSVINKTLGHRAFRFVAMASGCLQDPLLETANN